MALAVDDELVTDVDEPVGETSRTDPARTGSGVSEPVTTQAETHVGQAELGVVIVPGQGGQASTVGGYFFTLDEQGQVKNPTSISTTRILEAARETGLPIYVQQNGKMLSARLDASGHSIVPLGPIVPNNDLMRSMALPEHDQHAYLDRHLENLEAYRHNDHQPQGQPQSVRPMVRSVVPPQALSLPQLPAQPERLPRVEPDGVIPAAQPSATTVRPSLNVTLPVSSNEVPSQESGSDAEPDVTQQVSPDVSLESMPGFSQATEVPEVDSSPDAVSQPQHDTAPGTSTDRPEAARPTIPVADRDAAQGPDFVPFPEQISPSEAPYRKPEAQTAVRNEQPVQPQPQYGRRPRKQRSPAPVISSDAPSQLNDVGASALTDEAQVSDGSAPGQPKAPQRGRRVTDHQGASRPLVSTTDLPSSDTAFPTVGESALNVEQASPAIASGGVGRRAAPVKPAIVTPPSTPPPAVTGEPTEELDQANAAPELLPITPVTQVPPNMVGGGVLEGVMDSPEAQAAQEAAWKKELAEQQLELQKQGRRGVAARDLGYDRGIDRPSLAKGDSYDALQSASDQAQERLPVNEPVANAFAAQVPQNLQARAARFAQLRAQRQAKDGKVQDATTYAQTIAREARDFINAAYKRSWQVAQEVAEDTALSFGDFMLLSGPVVIALYAGRWVFGNIMGNLFTREVSLPSVPKVPGVSSKVTVQLVPGYSIGDMLDYVRHMKFILIGAITVMIYGFMTIVLYYTFRPSELLKLGLKGLEVLIGLLTP